MKRNAEPDTKDSALPWRRRLRRGWAWIALAVILAFTAGIRLRLLEMPLERDEGEYAYMGQLMLQGIPPYQTACNMKFPGVYAAYAVIMALFGQTASGIHLGVLLLNAGAIAVVFVLTRRFWDDQAGLVAAASYALMTMDRNSLGMAGHATHFVILPALGAILLMLIAIRRNRLRIHFVSGLLLGIAIMMKQPAVLFIPFVLLYPLWAEMRRRPVEWKMIFVRMAAVSAGVLLPLAIMFILLWRVGVFPKFWFWTFVYARAYGSIVTLPYVHQWLWFGFSQLTSQTLPLWIMAGVGLVLLFLSRSGRRKLPFVVAFTVFSFLAVCPGWWFRPHYFILMMPAVAMLIGGAICTVRRQAALRRMPVAGHLALAVFLAAAAHVLYLNGNMLLRMSPEAACKYVYETHPFVEARRVGEWLRDNSRSQDKVAVLGSEPQIYFYSHRKSATSYLYVFPLMEPHEYALEMQHEMAAELEAAEPEYIVFMSPGVSWRGVPGRSYRWIFEWFDEYDRAYDVVGIVTWVDYQPTYLWNEAAVNYVRSGDDEVVLVVAKRKQAPSGNALRPGPMTGLERSSGGA